jgi:P pilus assembly chaperone PapD
MEQAMAWLRNAGRKAKTAGRHTIWWLPACLLLAADLAAGVLVAPTSVYLSDRNRTGRMTVQNPSDKPQEISIRLSFGIPESDSLGNVSVSLTDSNITDPRSAVNFIKVFPRKIVVAPGDKQIIRFVANPPKDLADGEYWARVVVRSEEGQTTIPSPTKSEGITTKLNMVMQTAIALKYRTGNLTSQLDVTDTKVRQTDSTVEFRIRMANRGNVSYIGLLQCRLLDAQGTEISVKQMDLAVYRELNRNVILPVVGTTFKKPFKVELSIGNEGRKDIAPEDMIPGNRIEFSTLVQ